MADEEYQFQHDREPRSVRFDPSFTWGNVGSAIVTLIAIAVAYTKLESKTSSNETQMAELKSVNSNQIAELKNNLQTLNNTLVETNLSVRELKTVVQFEGQKTRQQNDR